MTTPTLTSIDVADATPRVIKLDSKKKIGIDVQEIDQTSLLKVKPTFVISGATCDIYICGSSTVVSSPAVTVDTTTFTDKDRLSVIIDTTAAPLNVVEHYRAVFSFDRDDGQREVEPIYFDIVDPGCLEEC